jgi:hypothetical protein
MIKFAFYGRVSTEDQQDPESSRSWQLTRSRALIEARGGGSLIDELQRWKAAAPAEVEELRGRIAELAERLARVEERPSRLVIAWEVVDEVLDGTAAEASPEGVTAPAGSGRRPPWRPGLEASVLPQGYRDLLEVAEDAGRPQRAAQIAAAKALAVLAAAEITAQVAADLTRDQRTGIDACLRYLTGKDDYLCYDHTWRLTPHDFVRRTAPVPYGEVTVGVGSRRGFTSVSAGGHCDATDHDQQAGVAAVPA